MFACYVAHIQIHQICSSPTKHHNAIQPTALIPNNAVVYCDFETNVLIMNEIVSRYVLVILRKML